MYHCDTVCRNRCVPKSNSDTLEDKDLFDNPLKTSHKKNWHDPCYPYLTNKSIYALRRSEWKDRPRTKEGKLYGL